MLARPAYRNRAFDLSQGPLPGRTGVKASCHDCHIPHTYPELLWYKAKAGIHDAVAEMRGVIVAGRKVQEGATAPCQIGVGGIRATDSANCRVCHAFTSEVLAKQKPFVQPMHQQVLSKQATCIDCHKGVAHAAPDE